MYPIEPAAQRSREREAGRAEGAACARPLPRPPPVVVKAIATVARPVPPAPRGVATSVRENAALALARSSPRGPTKPKADGPVPAVANLWPHREQKLR